jgi:hypothetical protein
MASEEAGMRKRIARISALLAVIAALAIGATAAYGSFFAGTYAGRITGVQGIQLPKGGNMKFKISASGRVTSFKWSKIYVSCTDGKVHRSSGHIRTNTPIVNRVFKIHASNVGSTATAKGLIRGQNHARGLFNLKGRIPTTAGEKTCKTGRQFWSAGHVRGT